MSDETYYSLQVIHVEGIQRKAKNAVLCVEIELDKVIRETGTLNDEGRPERNDTLIFSRSGDGAGVFCIRLKEPSGLIGQVTVDAEELLQESTGIEVQRELRSEKKRSVFGRKRSKRVGNITLRLGSIDSQTRAENELKTAEQSIERIQALVNRIDDRDEVIGTVIDVAERIISIVDEVAKIHPIFDVSWKAVTALYKLVDHQIQTDSELCGLVEDMRTAFDFSKEADKLDDSTDRLKPIVKKLLRETVDCSRFVQKYAKQNLPGRMFQRNSANEIKDFSEKFLKLRTDLDTAIGLNTKKDVGDTKLLLRLEASLQPVKSDASSLSRRPRCLPGTRKEYLKLITEFLSDATYPNVLWLTGAAGSGKSTIALTASDECRDKKCPLAYVFFEREKSDPYTVIRTIAYTLASDHPSTIGRHVLKVLKEGKSTCDAEMEDQFEKLLQKTLHAVAAEIAEPIIIILDALDECGSAEQRHDLLQLLVTNFVGLPSKVRILVTSRPEGDITDALQRNAHIRREELRPDSKDVDLFIRQKMADALGTEPRGEAWGDKLQILCDAADGLFIWASTAVKMVRIAVNKGRTFQRLVDDVQSIGKVGLDSLYVTALAGSEVWEQDSTDEGSAILGLILFAKEAMHATVIEAFLGLESGAVDEILKRLQSVVSYESGKPVRLHHASFADYLLSSERSGGKSWHIDEANAKRTVAERCFDTMTRNLCFNICDIESSFLPNSAVPGLEERIESKIPSHLNYACRHWSTHMCELGKGDRLDQVRDKLERFAKDQLLYWLEVLSLTGSFSDVAGKALRKANLWITTADAEVSAFLTNACILVTNSAKPISESAPHIYLSAVSLWKDESRVAEHYSRTHPVVKIHTIGMRTLLQCIKMLEAGSLLHSMTVSRDGRFIASSSEDKRIRVWDIDSGELVSSDFEMDKEGAVAFSPDNKYIVSCSRKGIVCAWDLGRRERTSTYSIDDQIYQGRDGRTSVTFSANGKRVIAVCSNRNVHTFDFDNGRLEHDHDWFKADIEFGFVSTNGSYVVGAKDIDKWCADFAVWDLDTGKQVSRWIATYNGLIESFDVSSDGTRVAAGLGGGFRIWNVDSGDLAASTNRVHHVTSVAFFPDGKRVITGNGDGEIAILDAGSGDIIWGPIKGLGSINSVKVSSDGKRVFSASNDDIRVWDIDSTSDQINSGSLDAHTDDVRSVAFSSDDKRIVSGSNDETIRIWDAGSGELLKGPFRGHGRSVVSVAFSPDGARVVSGSKDKTVRIWDANTGEQVLSLDGHKGWVWSVAFSADGKRIVSGSGDKTICIWDANTGELVKNPLTGHATPVYSVSLSPDSKRVVSGSLSGTVRIWDVESGETVVGPLEGHSSSVHSVAFSQDGKRVASGSDDATIRVWNADSGALVSRLGPGAFSYVASISFSPNGERIASGSWDKTVCIWEADTGNLVLGPLRGHENRVSSVSFSPDGNRVVSGSWDKTIRAWDVSSEAVEPGRSEGRAADDSKVSSPSLIDTGAKARGEGTFLDWELHYDGWIKGKGGELLTWIPEDRRDTLCRARNTAVFSCPFSTKLDFMNSPIGKEWARGYPLHN